MTTRLGSGWTDEECGEYRDLLRVLHEAQIALHIAGDEVDKFLTAHPTNGWMDSHDDTRPTDHDL